MQFVEDHGHGTLYRGRWFLCRWRVLPCQPSYWRRMPFFADPMDRDCRCVPFGWVLLATDPYHFRKLTLTEPQADGAYTRELNMWWPLRAPPPFSVRARGTFLRRFGNFGGPEVVRGPGSAVRGLCRSFTLGIYRGPCAKARDPIAGSGDPIHTLPARTGRETCADLAFRVPNP